VAIGAPSDANRPKTEDGLLMLAQPGRLSFRAVLASPTVRHAPPTPAPATSTSPPAAVIAKLGAAYPAAQKITDPDQVDPGTLATLAPFGALSPGEVAMLPSGMQYAVPTITCAQLNGRPVGAVDNPGALVVACERTGDQAKYLLDPAKVTAADVAGANVQLLPVPGWSVTIRFTPSGQGRWTALTRDAVANSPSNQVAIVVDNLVISAPTIGAVITSDAEISGAEIDRDAASRLGALLRSGPLPLVFVASSIAVHH
jgi:preprotein translocase subunit SecD